MMRKSIKINYLSFLLFSFLFITAGCKKDQLQVDMVKQYVEMNHTPNNPYDGGWSLTLSPGGTADIVPGGDIAYRGTYKINGSKIKVKTEQNSGTYNFNIINQTEIKESKFGITLKLK